MLGLPFSRRGSSSSGSRSDFLQVGPALALPSEEGRGSQVTASRSSASGSSRQASIKSLPSGSQHSREEGAAGRPGQGVPTRICVEEALDAVPSLSPRGSVGSGIGVTGGGPFRLMTLRTSRASEEALRAEVESLQLPSMCTCGNVFTDDAVYCRKCGMKRTDNMELPQVCACGEAFAEDSRFCHKCGRKRKAGRLLGIGGGIGGKKPMHRPSILEPRRMQMRALAQEIQDIEVVDLPPESRSVCAMVCAFLRFVFLCQWIPGARWLCSVVAHKDFIQTPIANSICGSVIILNTGLIGVEMEHNTGGQSSRIAWFIVESAFLAFFLGELLLRLRCLGLSGMRDPVMVFDCLLVVLGVADTWIAGAMVVSQAQAGSDALFKMTLLRLVRLARMVRVLRVIKLFRYFRELVLLARGIMGAIQGLSWSVVLILMLLYLCAVLTTSVYISMSQGDFPTVAIEQDISSWFGSIGSSLLTLFQVMTLEEWHVVVRTSNEVWSVAWMFFVPFILVANLALLNAVTAVVVEKVWSIAQSEASDEAKRSEKLRAKALVKFKQLFQSIDIDHNAYLDQDEFKAALDQPSVMQQLRDLGIAKCEAGELFELLDVDGNHVLSVAEFVDGCLRVIGPGKSKHLLQVQYDLLRSFRTLQTQVCDLDRNLKVVVKILSKVHGRKRPRRGSDRDQQQQQPLIGKCKSDNPTERQREERPKSMGPTTSLPEGPESSLRSGLGRRTASLLQPQGIVRRTLRQLSFSNPTGKDARGEVGGASSSSSGPGRRSSSSQGVRLKIGIIGATNLHLRSARGSEGAAGGPDAYCVCEVPCCSGGTRKFQTWAVTNETEPTWDHVEEVDDYAAGEPIVFTVFSEGGAKKGELLGKATLAGSSISGGSFLGELELQQAPQGQHAFLRLHVELASPPPEPKPESEVQPERPPPEEQPRPGPPPPPPPPPEQRPEPPPPLQRAGSRGPQRAGSQGLLSQGSSPRSLEELRVPGEEPQLLEPLSLRGTVPGTGGQSPRRPPEELRSVPEEPRRPSVEPQPVQPLARPGAVLGTVNHGLSPPSSAQRHTLGPMPSASDVKDRADRDLRCSVPASLGSPRATPPRLLAPPGDSLFFEVEPKPLVRPASKLSAPKSGQHMDCLLDTSWQEQHELNEILERLLEEAHMIHGHISEVASLNYETPDERRASLAKMPS